MQKSAALKVALENLDMEASSRVAQKAILEEIYLSEAKISRDPLIVYPEALSLEHKCSTEFLSSDKDKKLFLILCNFQVTAFTGKSRNNLVMKIEASFCTSYLVKTLPDDSLLDDFDYFMTINPISNAWPYWREFVQSMSTRMGFPALTVPLLEITAKKAASKKAKSQPAKKVSTRRKKLSA